LALELTTNLKTSLQNSQITPVFVAKIDGYSTLLTNVQVTGIVDQLSYISFSDGTTTRITQKLDPSRGQGSSVSQITIALIDVDNFITKFVSPGQILNDVMGRRVTIFTGVNGNTWPDDYNIIFRGIIQDINAAANVVYITLNNTEEKKRVSLLPKITGELSTALNFRSVTFQDIQFKNKEDVANAVSITYTGGGTAGSEVVTVGGGGYAVSVQIQSGVSTAAQIKKKIENNADANQVMDLKIVGTSGAAQVTGSANLGTDTTINVVDATSFLLPADTAETYVKIGEELIKYTGKTSTTLTGCTRGTGAAFYSSGDSLEQVVRITDGGIDIALKCMLSQGPTYYAESVPVLSFQYYDPSTTIDNAIFFDFNVKTDYGVSEGDLATTTGASNGANNVTDAVVVEVVVQPDNSSYVLLSNNLVDEAASPAVIKFKSQFNVLPIGLGMVPDEVDVAQHIFVRDTFLPIFDMDFYINDVADGKGFLEKQVYMPMTCFSVPRKGRSSIAYTIAPLASYEVVTLNSSTVENPEQLSVRRSLNENFFNQVRFNYDYDPITNSFLTTKNYPDTPDQALIPVGAKTYVVESQGLRASVGSTVTNENASIRLLRRYDRGAEFIKGIKVLFSYGYEIEIGDVVAVDFESLKLSDFVTGNRAGLIKLMQVINKVLDNKTGEVIIDVVNTTFGISDRIGLISPSSKTDAGSSTTLIKLKKSWSTSAIELESKKWTGYIGQEIIVHDESWSTVYNTVIRGFDNLSPQGMLVDLMPGVPGTDWIIQCPEYPSSTNTSELLFWKSRHCFFSPRIQVTAGIDVNQFSVNPGDEIYFFIGSIIRVHTYDFSSDSPEAVVTDITGSNITTNISLGFIPTNLHYVDLIGFLDKQQSYRVV
jgi:hypothetical protein